MPCQPIKKINQYPIHVQATMIPFQRKDQTSVPFWNKLKYLFRNISLITFSCAESCYLYVNGISLNCHRIPERWVRTHSFVVWCNPIWSDLMQPVGKLQNLNQNWGAAAAEPRGQVTTVDILSGGPPLKHVVKMLIEYLIRINSNVPLRSRLKKYFPEFSIWECDCW